jgi:hypothetical protein
MSSDTPDQASIRHKQATANPLDMFRKDIPSEAVAEAIVLKRGLEFGEIACRKCGSRDIGRVSGKRQVRCNQCNFQGSFTAGTFYDRKRNLWLYLFKEWTIEEGLILNSAEFARITGCATSTSQAIEKKYALVFLNAVPENSIEVPSSEFDDIIGRRSKETPARKHPRTEQEPVPENDASKSEQNLSISIFEEKAGTTSSDGAPNAVRSLVEPSFWNAQDELSLLQKLVFENLSETPTSFDDLLSNTKLTAGSLNAALVLLDLEGLAFSSSVDFYALGRKKVNALNARKPAFPRRPEVKKFVQYISSVHKFVSRKCLQLYLAVAWSRMASSPWQKGAITKLCLQHGPVRDEVALSFVSPLLVSFMPC